MAVLRIDGYVIVSADGMLTNANRVMPDELKFEGDKRFFTAALDHADLIVHGRHSGEDQPNSPRRKRLVLTRTISAIAPDPSNPKATLWNPAGDLRGCVRSHRRCVPAPLQSSADRGCSECSWTATIRSGSRRRRGCGCPDGEPCFPGVPARSPQEILAGHGLRAGPSEVLDAAMTSA